jgi:hypothetical protein
MVLCLVKLPMLTVVLAGAAWAVMSGRANVFALVGGVALVQAVIFLKAVSGLLVASLPPLPRPFDFRLRISDFGLGARNSETIANPPSRPGPGPALRAPASGYCNPQSRYPAAQPASE